VKALINGLIKHISIKGRLLLMFLVPGVIYYVFSTALSFSHIQSLSNARVIELQAVVESAVGKTAAQFLRRGLKQDLGEVLKSLVSDTAIAGAVVFDIEDTVFAQAGALNSNAGISVYTHEIYHQSVIPEFDDIDFNEGVSKGRPELIGTLVFYVDKKSTLGQSWQPALEDSILLFITILICSPFFYALYQSFNKPLSSILRDILEFEQGNVEWITRKDTGDDEFARIEKTLKRVATTVIEQTRQISNANKTLKHRAYELERQVSIATEAREDADRANAQKDTFVANVSHEMRQPLVGIVSGVDLVEQFVLCAQNRLMELNRSVSPEQYVMLTSVRADLKDAINGLGISKKYSKELTVMVDDLLASIQDMYQEIILHPSTFLLHDSLDVLLQSHHQYASAKELDYLYAIRGLDVDSPVYVMGDWVRISQVINNLIGNAIRFTDKGLIDIKADVNFINENVNIRFTISDSGVGINDHEKESIFKLFHIGEDPADKKYAGLGTGLTIAQKISQKMEGMLNLEYSKAGAGTRFSFEISLPISSVEVLKPEDAILPTEKRTSLLYVEDSPINRQVFQMYCELSSIDLILATNGKEGLERYKSHHFDALIVDCYMPEMNGFDFVMQIRQGENDLDSTHIPIFALTADASKRNKERCFNAGFDEFLTKPYNNATFRFLIDRIKDIQTKSHQHS